MTALARLPTLPPSWDNEGFGSAEATAILVKSAKSGTRMIMTHMTNDNGEGTEQTRI